MPSWGILSKKKSRKRTSSAHTVHFKIAADAGHESDSKSRSSSVPSEASDHLFHLHYQHEVCNGGDAHHHDLQHDDEEDEEERECLKHLDHLSLALENTFKEVESIDAFVNKLRQEFQHEEMSEKRFMSCICSARIARVACCKKQIEVWRQLQHDIQEFCCHHHPHEEEELNQHSDDCPALNHELTYDSDSSLCSHDAADVDFVVCRLNKMVLFDLVKHRLDPMADTRSFVEHWIMKGSQGDDHCLASS